MPGTQHPRAVQMLTDRHTGPPRWWELCALGQEAGMGSREGQKQVAQHFQVVNMVGAQHPRPVRMLGARHWEPGTLRLY